MLEPSSDESFMREALRMAQKAYDADEVPVGAVVVHEGRIIARAFNQVELLKDATAHAEMLALTQAEAAVGDWRLIDCDLYVTKEPCAMCAGAEFTAKNAPRLLSRSPLTVRSSNQFSRFCDNDGDDGGRSDAHCTCSLGARNNMNTDSRHTDNSGHTGADSTHRDNN